MKPVSTVRQPLNQAVYLGIQKFISSINHPHATIERVLLKTELVIRDSTCTNKRLGEE